MSICLSGGADGADRLWGACAEKAGHEVCHFTFGGHGAARWAKGLKLTQEQLEEADPHLYIANQTLKRSFPVKSHFVNNLLRRNWWQVKDTDAVYAVGFLMPDNLVAGGTSWAVQMYRDRFMGADGDPVDPPRLYLFEQAVGEWLTATYDGWISAGAPPAPQGRWTGIGTRALNDLGEAAIRGMFE